MLQLHILDKRMNMNKKELNSLLLKAKKCRDYGEMAEAIAILHQIVNQYPEDVYYYLLASTYFESRESESALEYADRTLEINDKNKEAYELKGIIFEKAEEWEKAEEMYLKALEIDYDFYEARDHLVQLYFWKQKRYEDTIKQCKFVFSYKKFDFSTRKKLCDSLTWEVSFSFPLYASLIHSHQYEEAIKVLLKLKKIEDEAGVSGDYNQHTTDEILYKLYFITNNPEGIKEYRNIWLSYYKIKGDEFEKWEKEAMNGIIVRQLI
jgi:tetratricopeptide (TPR) repeat protein